jgi:catechol 2,3-dioxygenase-like lactoylglutathione lyase family enzyme
MRAEALFHTGIVVEDVEATKRWLTGTAGYRWCDPMVGEHEVETADGPRTVAFDFAYSMSEPRLEIIRAQPGTIWQPTGSGLHHLGYWSDDVGQDLATLTVAGLAVEACGRDPSGSLVWAYCKGSAGPRIELVTRALEPILTRLFATGRLGRDQP